jgi:hypothetical protein
MITRRHLLPALALILGAASAAFAQPAGTPPSPLAPIAHWVGGQWVGLLQSPSGKSVTLIRTYEWSFDKRLVIGRSFGEVDGQRRQSRETVYAWNPDTKRIEFTDFIDNGGWGAGFVEPRDGKLYMEARVVGNPGHPSWRAWIEENGDKQVIRVEAQKDGQWVPFGTFPYEHRR